ncbi:MAG: SAM-dependent DNA methyltransferase [Phormidium sp. GEM2.Bin31]|nr:MAG: SAM-dependent DNA methyltransferase [Phormidium sp. GEM2.Bin31]
MAKRMGNGDPSNNYLLNTSVQHRKNYGQFFTPPEVARLMLHWVFQAQPRRILDPAFGLGVFYRELLNSDIETLMVSPYQFIGYDIDPVIVSYSQDIVSDASLTLITGDYLKADIKGVDAIICNPPYMRFQKFFNRKEIQSQLEDKIGYKLRANSNLASVFLMKSLAELNPQGCLAFIMPFECFNASYIVPLKRYLLKHKLLKQIVLISNEKDLFPDVITTVCVLLCQRNYKRELVKLSYIDSQEQLDSLSDFTQWYQAEIPLKQLPAQEKWSPVLESVSVERIAPNGFAPFSDYGCFKRGIATGANVFFSLKPSRLAELQLEPDCYRSCISKSQQIQDLVLTEQSLEELARADKAVYCLDVLNADHPPVNAYIAFGEHCGYHQRYLTKMRHPWYKLERRETAPLWLGVFYRGRFKVVRNLSTALHLTCFHSFYPKPAALPLLERLFVYLISDAGQGVVQLNCRHYGNGLDKFEPGDLNQSLAPNPEQLQRMDERLVSKVLHLAQEDAAGAIALSNQLMEPIYPGH